MRSHSTVRLGSALWLWPAPASTNRVTSGDPESWAGMGVVVGGQVTLADPDEDRHVHRRRLSSRVARDDGGKPHDGEEGAGRGSQGRPHLGAPAPRRRARGAPPPQVDERLAVPAPGDLDLDGPQPLGVGAQVPLLRVEELGQAGIAPPEEGQGVVGMMGGLLAHGQEGSGGVAHPDNGSRLPARDTLHAGAQVREDRGHRGGVHGGHHLGGEGPPVVGHVAVPDAGVVDRDDRKAPGAHVGGKAVTAQREVEVPPAHAAAGEAEQHDRPPAAGRRDRGGEHLGGQRRATGRRHPADVGPDHDGARCPGGGLDGARCPGGGLRGGAGRRRRLAHRHMEIIPDRARPRCGRRRTARAPHPPPG